MAAWLDLVSGAGELSLVDTGRLDTIIREMSYPREQYPSVLYFAGNGTRMNALRGLFPQNNVMRRGPSGLVRVHISTSTAHTAAPTILLESNPFSQNGLGDTACLNGPAADYQRRLLSWQNTGTLAETQQDIVTNCILPWTHVLCLFVSSQGEIERALRLLKQPPRALTVGGRRVPQLMRVVMVLTQDLNGAKEVIPQPRLQSPHAHITILDLRSREGLSDVAAFEPLRRLLLDEIRVSKEAQEADGLEFSALHLLDLWKESLRLYNSKHDGSPILDCLMFAREGRNAAIHECLEDFLKEARNVACPANEAAEFIASALLMDAYPPEMHHFHPELVFNALYRGSCHESLAIIPGLDCERILDHFIRAFDDLNPVNSAAAARRTALRRFHQRWAGLHSTKACLFCMFRRPEHVMPCKHTICDNCVVIFGAERSVAEYHTDLLQCPICADRFKLTIRRVPPTKGPVIFSLDGGGARGYFQLGLLQAVEKRLEGMPFAELPDFCIGTSVGALSDIDLFLNNVSANEAFAKFPDLARMVFRSSSAVGPLLRATSIIGGALRMLGGSRYDICELEQVLQKTTDPDRRIFDVPTAISGCRVAVVASRTSDGKACVLANYRGLGRRRADAESAYTFFIPQNEKENPRVIDVAQCSVAAPFFFRTKSLPGVGTLQDGGVRANNPLAIALKESTVIWPSNRKPDLALSVGTGYCLDSHERVQGGPGVFNEGALSRMIRATIYSPCMDGRQGFHEALNYLTEYDQPEVFRLDYAIDGRVPRLDDVDSVIKMSGSPFTVADELVRALLATAFFFELDEIPVRKGGNFHCTGSILCARRPVHAVLQCVGKEFPDATFRTSSCNEIGRAVANDGCDICGYYRKKVSITVNNLAEEFCIELSSNTLHHRIGGFPKSVQQITREQQIYSHFGRADHRRGVWPPKRVCYCVRGDKRSIGFSEPKIDQKKRRL